MNIFACKVFCDLVDCQSFSSAAALNGISQPAVSQQIRSLEKELDCRLLNRTTRSFALTPQGKLFHESAGKILRIHGQLLQDLNQTIVQPGGEIRLSTIFSVGLHELPNLVQHFLRDHPNVKVHVDYRRAAEVYDDLRQKKAELGLVAFPERHSDIETEIIRNDPMILICHPNHPLAEKPSIPFANLAQHAYVSFDADLSTQKALEQVFKKHGFSPKIAATFDHPDALKRAVEMDMGVSIVPLSTVKDEQTRGTLRVVIFNNEKLIRPLAVLRRREHPLSPMAQAFLDILRKV
ncbi:MAG: LysR family transcriptional regulator [Verrucomicrobiae bacterium]|nr:LysR family transcriptional regulator [Verrucomicrobiae bacterium]